MATGDLVEVWTEKEVVREKARGRYVFPPCLPASATWSGSPPRVAEQLPLARVELHPEQATVVARL